MKIVLGVGGGIAAYKSALLLRRFTEAGHDVTVLPTSASLNFVGAATWEALSGRKVPLDTFDDVEQVNHVRIGHEADLVVISPATADLLARAAHGLADDLLTNTLLMATCPVVFAPAMHTQMWQHPATVANVAKLRERGATVIEPASGRLTGTDSGPGRLPEPEDIFVAAMDAAGKNEEQSRPLAGKTIVVTAGGTREPLDPVRFLGNRSSGKQGVAVAKAARDAGATVTIIGANLQVLAPHGIGLVEVESTEELREATITAAGGADVVVMAAAVADYRPAQVATHKMKKSDDGTDPVIALERTPDILAEISAKRAEPGQVVVGFAAETGDENGTVLEHATKKLRRKGCDLLVVNDVGSSPVFGADENAVTILAADGSAPIEARGSKDDVARAVVSRLADLADAPTQAP